jgi:hypothetical protein
MIFVTDERSSSCRSGERRAISYRRCISPRTTVHVIKLMQEREIKPYTCRFPDEKNVNTGLAQNVAQSGCLMGLGQTEERSNGNSDRDGPHWRYPASFRRD